VTIRGTAQHEEFQYYKIEFGAASRDRVSFLSSEERQVTNNSLGVWDTSAVPDGDYRVRVTVVRKDGNYPSPCNVSVTVKNS